MYKLYQLCKKTRNSATQITAYAVCKVYCRFTVGIKHTRNGSLECLEHKLQKVPNWPSHITPIDSAADIFLEVRNCETVAHSGPDGAYYAYIDVSSALVLFFEQKARNHVGTFSTEA